MPNTGTSTLLVWIQGCLAFKVLWNPHLCLLLHITVWRLPLRAWGSGPVTRPSRSIIVNLYHVSDAFRPQHTHTHTQRELCSNYKQEVSSVAEVRDENVFILESGYSDQPTREASSRAEWTRVISCGHCCFSHFSGTFYRVTTLKNSLSPTICPPYSP